MNDIYWTCPDCNSPNPYPDATECEVCSRHITEKEIEITEKRIKDIAREREEQERAARKELEERKRREAELERLKRLEEKRRLKREALVKHRNLTIKLNDIMKPFARVMSVICIIAVLASSVIVGISVVRRDSVAVMTNNIEATAQRIYEDFEDGHYFIYSDGEKEFIIGRNLRIQMQYLERHFRNSRGLKYLTEVLGW